MRADDIINAIGQLDESLIAPAAADVPRGGKRRAPRAMKLIAIAAAAIAASALLLFAGLSVGRPRSPVVPPEATQRTAPEEPGIDPGYPGTDRSPITDTDRQTEPGSSKPTDTEPAVTEPVYVDPEPITDPEPTEPTWEWEPQEPPYTDPEPTEPAGEPGGNPVTGPVETEPQDPTAEPDDTEPGGYIACEPADNDPTPELYNVTKDDFYVIMYRTLGSTSRPQEQPDTAGSEQQGHSWEAWQICEEGAIDSVAGSEPGCTDTDEITEAKQWYRRTFSEIESEGAGQSSGGEVTPLPMTKAQLAVRLYNAAHNIGVILPAVRDWPWFDDYAEGRWYSDAVFEAYRAGIINAAGEHHLGTDEPISVSEAEAAVSAFAAILLEKGALVAGN